MSQVKFKRISGNLDLPLPDYATPKAAGMDFRAFLPDGPVTFEHMDSIIISTGFDIELPEGTEMQIRPRSGLAIKHKLIILNSPGTIDEDYRGCVMIGFYYLGKTSLIINHGDRIAQGVISEVRRYKIVEADELSLTERGAGGFGSTGMK